MTRREFINLNIKELDPEEAQKMAIELYEKRRVNILIIIVIAIILFAASAVLLIGFKDHHFGISFCIIAAPFLIGLFMAVYDFVKQAMKQVINGIRLRRDEKSCYKYLISLQKEQTKCDAYYSERTRDRFLDQEM